MLPVELSFYCDVLSTEKEAFWRFVKALMAVGAVPTGQAQIRYEGTDSLGKTRFEPDKIDKFFASAGVEVSSLMMTNVLGLPAKNIREEVSLVGASPEAKALGDHSPFALRIAEDVFTKKMIPQMIKRTLQIIEVVRPHYAAFTWVDDYLMCPPDLPKMTRPFHDFYISRDFIGETHYQKILTSFHDAYQHEFEHGIFVSTSWMQPPHAETSAPRNCDVARMIYNRWSNHKLYPGY